jgi:hypothetical protein
MNSQPAFFETVAARSRVTLRLALVLTVCFAISSLAAPPFYAETKSDARAKQLDDKKKKLGKLKSPEDRAVSYVEIASITLACVSDAIAVNDLPKLMVHIEDYRQNLRGARDTMVASGLDSYKSPKGYKTIELATRAHLRILTDFARRLSLDNRRPLEETIDEVSKIRGEMLHILFP